MQRPQFRRATERWGVLRCRHVMQLQRRSSREHHQDCQVCMRVAADQALIETTRAVLGPCCTSFSFLLWPGLAPCMGYAMLHRHVSWMARAPSNPHYFQADIQCIQQTHSKAIYQMGFLAHCQCTGPDHFLCGPWKEYSLSVLLTLSHCPHPYSSTALA